MGDWADWHNDNALRPLEPEDEPNPEDDEIVDSLRKMKAASTQDKTCKYCNKKGLYWGKHDGKFRLFDGINVHSCSNGRKKSGS